jgi:hypothetical protein
VKILALAASLAVCAGGAFAGGIAEPVTEPAVVEVRTTSDAGRDHEKNGLNPRPLPPPAALAAASAAGGVGTPVGE